MSNCNMKISGLTPSKKIPEILYSLPHNETSETQKLSLTKTRPGIKNIISFQIKIIIKSYKKLFNTSFCGLIVNAVRHIEFMYKSVDNSVHTAKYDIPFDIPIKLNNSSINVQKILIDVIKSSIQVVDSKSFYLTSTVFTVALIGNSSSPKEYIKKVPTDSNCQKINPINNKCLNTFQPNYNYFWNSCLLLILIFIILNTFTSNCFQGQQRFLI